MVSLIAHEFGHYFMCRRLGARVDRFSIGMGRLVYSKKMYGTEWCIRLLPFGGSNEVNEEDFIKLKPAERILVFAAGPLVNVMIAVVSISIVLFIKGSFSPLSVLGNMASALTIILGSLWETLVQSATTTEPVIAGSVDMTSQMFAGAASLTDYVKTFFAYLYSMNFVLAITNLLPVPSLDGGQIAMTSFAVFNRPIPAKAYAVIKATDVMIGKGRLELSARNQFPGRVTAVEEGAVNGLVKMEVLGGNTVTATISMGSIRDLGLKPGVDAVAVVKATSVMIGI